MVEGQSQVQEDSINGSVVDLGPRGLQASGGRKVVSSFSPLFILLPQTIQQLNHQKGTGIKLASRLERIYK